MPVCRARRADHDYEQPVPPYVVFDENKRLKLVKNLHHWPSQIVGQVSAVLFLQRQHTRKNVLHSRDQLVELYKLVHVSLRTASHTRELSLTSL